MSEEAAFALLRKQRLFLSAPAAVKVKEALAGMEEEESQQPFVDEASQPDSLLVLLPPECLAHIVSFLPTEEIFSLAATCCELLGAILADNVLWKRLYERHFGGPLAVVEGERCWRTLMLGNVKQMQGTGSRRRIGSRLYWAASQGHLTYIQTALHERKLWPDEQVQSELLSRAAEAGHAHIIRQLIPVMVKADEKATDANRAIHIAAVNGHTAGCYSGVVQALIEFDKKMVNAANNFGTTPLHLAVYAGKTATAAFLLKHGASPNARDKAKVTPIHNAVARGSHDLFWLLVAYGARCDILDKEGETLTDWARCFKRVEMEEPIACALAQARKQAAAAFSV